MVHSRWWRNVVVVDLLSLAAVMTGAVVPLWTQLSPGTQRFAVMYGLLVLALVSVGRPRLVGRSTMWLEPVAWVPARFALAAVLALAIDFVRDRPTWVVFAVTLWAATVLSVLAARGVLGLSSRLSRGLPTNLTLIVGAGAVGLRVARRLLQRPELGLTPVGFLDSDPMPQALELAAQVPVLGSPDQIAEISARTGAHHVILAFSHERDAAMVKVVEECQRLGISVSVVPRLYETVNGRVTLEHFGGVPILWLRPVDLEGWQFALKHGLDRLLALLALLVLAPLLAAIAVAVRLSSPGPVIFRQRRVGRGGQTFDLLKFRSMVHAPQSDFAPADGLAPGGVEGSDRRTAVGRLLRKTSLDELPQLVNVLRGEMSLVGPRPERPEFVAQFEQDVDRYPRRHRVKSGITGWAQVNGLRGQTSIADRVEWDNHYIENWSLRLELKTLLRTVAEVVRLRDDARQGSPAGSVAPSPAQAFPSAAQMSFAQPPAAPRVAPAGSLCAPRLLDAAPLEAVRAPAPGTAEHIGAVADEHGLDPASFIVLDSRLVVQNLSEEAASLLGRTAEEVKGRRVSDFLLAASPQREDAATLKTALSGAPAPDHSPRRLLVRARGTFGVRLKAAVWAADPPGIVMIVLEPSLGRVSPELSSRRVADPAVGLARHA